mmetsp:Transcript_29060/g.42860  ORF Transcript_29060/g.42860 Transcript_29060/m.42860 type:complete len:92 (+) Transcript_29060:374-649(+)
MSLEEAIAPAMTCSNQKWTTEDEAALEGLKNKEILLADTALGRLKETRKREFHAAFDAMTPRDQEVYLENYKHINYGSIDHFVVIRDLVMV